jgi:hypothetical protein
LNRLALHAVTDISPEQPVQFDAVTSHSEQLLLHSSQKPFDMNFPISQSPPGNFVQFVAVPLQARQVGSQRWQKIPSL